MNGAIFANPQTSIASASTTKLNDSDGVNVKITGTTGITSFGAARSGLIRFVEFAGILTLTHNATSLILPTAANIMTASGDTLIALSLGSSNWKVIAYQRKDGTPLAGGSGGLSTTGPSAFTPTVTFQTVGDFSPSYTAQNGRYYVIGKRLFFDLEVHWTNNGYTTASGELIVGGLPVAISASAIMPNYGVRTALAVNVPDTRPTIFARPSGAGTSTLRICAQGDNVADAVLGSSEFGPGQNHRLFISGNYEVA